MLPAERFPHTLASSLDLRRLLIHREVPMSSKNTSLLDSTLREAAAYNPFLRGRFPVGVQAFEAHDKARDRLFPCEVWYPAAAEHAAQDLDPKIQDCFIPRLRNTEQRQSAVRDAAAHAGTYPLIISVVSQRFVKQVSAVGRTQLQGGHADATGPTVDAIYADSFPVGRLCFERGAV